MCRRTAAEWTPEWTPEWTRNGLNREDISGAMTRCRARIGTAPGNRATRQRRRKHREWNRQEWNRRAAVAITAGTTIAENPSASARRSSESALRIELQSGLWNAARLAQNPGPPNPGATGTVAAVRVARAAARTRKATGDAAVADANNNFFPQAPDRSSGFGAFFCRQSQSRHNIYYQKWIIHIL